MVAPGVRRGRLPAWVLGLELVLGLGCVKALRKGAVWAAAELGLCWLLPCQPLRGPQAAGAGEGLKLHQGALLRLPWGMGDPSVQESPPAA